MVLFRGEEARYTSHISWVVTSGKRQYLELHKSSSKLAEVFSAHCVDSWVLAYIVVEGNPKPENERMLRLVPYDFRRRQLHLMQPAKGGLRRENGSTRSLGLKRGTLVNHLKFGVVYVGGSPNGRLSLHCMRTGKRLTKDAKKKDCVLLTLAPFRVYLVK